VSTDTIQSPLAGLTPEQLEELGREFDAIHDEVFDELGDRDRRYITSMIEMHRRLAVMARVLLLASRFKPAWVLGTIVGVLAGGVIADPSSLGLDAVFPAFFLGLLVVEVQRPGARLVCALSVVIALALIPVAPPGVPIIASALAALAVLRR